VGYEEMKIYNIWKMKVVRAIIFTGIDLVAVVPLTLTALYGRYKKKEFDVGIGSVPLINSPCHKKAFELYGHTAQTFVSYSWFITNDFDINFCNNNKNPVKKALGVYRAFFHSLLHYKCLLFYYNGIFTLRTPLIGRLEPYLLKLSNTKLIAIQYGSDVQIFERSGNFLFKDRASKDYPNNYIYRYNISDVRRDIDKWTRHADHIISGCDWIEYIPFWNTIISAHFAYDTKNVKVPKLDLNPKEYVVLHAPNHRHIKGTEIYTKAVEKLKQKGYPVRLNMIERMPNEEILKAIETCYVVADQLVIGWYAYFSIEAMARGKPCICYQRQDFLDFYEQAGVIEKDEVPLINCNHTIDSVANAIEKLIVDKDYYKNVSERSLKYVDKHHSIEYIGSVFDKIYKEVVKE
jgi:glycosyltransferase involved in cell wall biosynthesis